MKRKLIITTCEEKIVTSLLENDEIAEFHVSELSDEPYRLGSIYIGRVKKIVSNIRAAFIEIGAGMECYYNMDEKGSLPIRVGDEFMVQISKEAMKTKQPSVTRNISLAGKYCVLTKGDTRIGISGKLSREKGAQLMQQMTPYVSSEYGFIVRTNAKDCSFEELKKEAERLVKEYETLKKTASTRVCFSCLKEAPSAYLTDLKNIYQEGLEEILVEEKTLYDEISAYLAEFQPEDMEKLRLYEDALLPLHKLYSIEIKLRDALKEKVWMKSGAYLVIQPTEALTVIDVNTGKCIGKKKDDKVYFKINAEAAREAARQIRLRNLSGIILIDFVNLEHKEKMQELLELFNGYLRQDPIQTTLVDMTKLQLVEVTRKKVRKPLHEAWNEKRNG